MSTHYDTGFRCSASKGHKTVAAGRPKTRGVLRKIPLPSPPPATGDMSECGSTVDARRAFSFNAAEATYPTGCSLLGQIHPRALPSRSGTRHAHILASAKEADHPNGRSKETDQGRSEETKTSSSDVLRSMFVGHPNARPNKPRHPRTWRTRPLNRLDLPWSTHQQSETQLAARISIRSVVQSASQASKSRHLVTPQRGRGRQSTTENQFRVQNRT